MSGRCRGRQGTTPRRRGFTLVEVMIAASLLLLTAACATPLLVGGQRAVSREGRFADARRLAQSTLEHLRIMPFVSPSPAAADAAAASAGCVIAVLFPHADESRNGPDDFVVLAGDAPWPAGTFVTRRRVDVYLVTTASRFVAATPAGLVPVPAARLAGYDALAGGELPSGALAVDVRVSWTEGGDERSVTRHDLVLDESGGTSAPAVAASP